MRRRTLLVGLGAAGLYGPARAQGERAYRLAVFTHGNVPPHSPTISGLIDDLGHLGYAEAGKLAVEYFGAEGQPERLATMAAEVAQRRFDVVAVIFPHGVTALQKAGVSDPMVFLFGAGPVASGFVASLARP